MRKIENIVIHCSDSNWGDREIIDKWHKENGWSMIGYHYVILNGKRRHDVVYDESIDGIIEPGRELDNDSYMETKEVGAHAKFFNENSIGVCLIGTNKFAVKQFETLYNLLMYWVKLVPGIKILGHYQLNPGKTCPNIDINDLVKFIGSVDLTTNINNIMGKYLKI